MLSEFFRRVGTIVVFAALALGAISGCSSSGSGLALPGPSIECRLNRSACLYEGKYEANEEAYAEEEAKRLNRAQIERLRRTSLK